MKSRRPLVTAHAGCENTSANSPESLLAAIAAGADVAEVDVRSSMDGRLILMHDEPRADLPSPNAVITLETALDLLRSSDIMLNLDLKDDLCATGVVNMVRQRGLAGRVIVSGCGPARARLLRTLAPEFSVLLNVTASVDNLSGDFYSVFVADTCRSAVELQCRGINVEFHECRPQLVADAGEHDLPVSVWTVDEEQDMRTMIQMGVHSITTNRPGRLIGLLESWAVDFS